MPLKPRLRSRRDLVMLAAAAALAACATPPAPPAPAPAKPAPEPEAPPPPAAPPVAPPPASVDPVAPTEVSRTVAAAVELLETGDSEKAESELRRVIATDPNNRLAQSLLRQIREDPVALYGRESFSYRVQPGESLSAIARRFMGDVYLFYGLARYNGIKVPRALSGGQMIKVPGKAPAVQPAPAPTPAAPPSPPSPGPAPAAPVPPPVDKTAEIARLTKAARAAFARQDLDGALRNWDAVLKLDPENVNARTEGAKARQLKDKLKGVK